jgi:hypothetical protein
MKKVILTAFAAAGLSIYGYGQGVISIDGSLGTKTEINGVVNTTQDINFELLAFNGSTYVPVATLLLSVASGDSGVGGVPAGATEPAALDIGANADGTIYDANGNTYVVPGSVVGVAQNFEAEGWLGNTTYALATTSGITAVFSETPGAAASPILTVLNNMPLLNLTSVPEPATFAMMGLGGLSLLLFRRRK